MKNYIIIPLLIMMAACGKNQVDKNIQRVFKGPLFRNQQLGFSYSMVMKNEEEKYRHFTDTNMLKYHYLISDSEDFHWAYVFNNDRLSQIYFESFLGSIDHAKKYEDAIKLRYDKLLGGSTHEESRLIWRKDSVSAILFNESGEVQMGNIRMVFYKTGDSLTVLEND